MNDDMNTAEELIKVTEAKKEYDVLVKVMVILSKAENLEAAKVAITEWIVAKSK